MNNINTTHSRISMTINEAYVLKMIHSNVINKVISEYEYFKNKENKDMLDIRILKISNLIMLVHRYKIHSNKQKYNIEYYEQLKIDLAKLCKFLLSNNSSIISLGLLLIDKLDNTYIKQYIHLLHREIYYKDLYKEKKGFIKLLT